MNVELSHEPSKLFEHIPGGYYFSKNLRGEFLYCNNNLMELFNLKTLSDIKNKTDFHFLRNDIAHECREEDLNIVGSEVGYENKDNYIVDISGKEFHFTTTKIPLRNNEGDVVGVEGWMFLSDNFVKNNKYCDPFESSLKYLEENFGHKISIDVLSKKAYMSKSTFSRRFNKTFEMSPLAYIKKYRLRKACEFLKEGMDISAVTSHCGFCDQSHFTKAFRSHYNITPKEYQRLLLNN